jgi:hypothetical protein
MASTALKTENEKEETFDSLDVLHIKVEKLAEMIKKSSHFVVFTGAGISTMAGVQDYRSGANTILPTGAGAWELKANILK